MEHGIYSEAVSQSSSDVKTSLNMRPSIETTGIRPIGRQVIADLTGIPPSMLVESNSLMNLLEDALKAGGMTILDVVKHIFPGGGFTAVFLLSESHAAIHTYPEHNYLALDIFTCAQRNPYDVLQGILSTLHPSGIMISEVARVPVTSSKKISTNMTNQQQVKQKPSVGVAVVIWRSEKKDVLLLGLGHSAENRNEIYAVPGGHWESGETLAAAAMRETAEEAGIRIRALRLVSVYEFYNSEKQKSYVTIGFEAFLESGEPSVMEPDKKANWNWHSPGDALKLPLFAPDKVLVERAISGTVYPVSE